MPDTDQSFIPMVDSVTSRLCKPDSLRTVWQQPSFARAMPSVSVLEECMQRLRAIIFPGYFGTQFSMRSIRYHMSANLDSVFHLFREQIKRGIAFDKISRLDDDSSCSDANLQQEYEEAEAKEKKQAEEYTLALLDSLPAIRELLTMDAQAGYEGDPAATSPGETIFCYPSMHAMLHHRIAHVLYSFSIPLIPRIISEMAHAKTGIDIHPGASIGSSFFIDHGTGVVVGETAVVGNNCRLYQGVTLGALSFPKNADGSLTKGIPRHPVLGNKVTVYAGATILGRVHLGDGCVIGGNVWITEDVAAGARVLQGKKND
ncbi:MAG: serine O-acetyltransferase [Desulfovibrio sp.]|nr:serine O-acetyltransferase [Desulfovibrio sp.]